MNPFKMPPFWFLLATLSQFGIAWASALPAYSLFRVAAGYGLIVVGVALVLGTWVSFRKWQTPICPFTEPTHLITDGLFRYSRNPLYLGEVVMLIGLSALHGNWATLIPVLVFFVVIQIVFVRPEEKTLLAEYGDSFEDYRKKVRAWI